MKILHRYILQLEVKNLFLSLMVLILLFIVIDFFDRIDNILQEQVSVGLIAQYFLYKIPVAISLMLPAAMLISTLLTFGILSKNSEFTAMRAAGLQILWLARPVLVVGLFVSLFSIAFNETVVPYSTMRVREIYNIDIKKKHEKGAYSQTDYWWRVGNQFYSAELFDSRENRLHNLSRFTVDNTFRVTQRTVAGSVSWLNPALGWSMHQVQEYSFKPDGEVLSVAHNSLPLPIDNQPKDFYRVKTDPDSMSYSDLKRFIEEQAQNGVQVLSYLADLYAKISFPFVNFIIVLIALPFALLPSRSGSMATSLLAGGMIGFSYYVVHSFSISMARAELWPPLLAAWMANAMLGLVGVILNLGAESP